MLENGGDNFDNTRENVELDAGRDDDIGLYLLENQVKKVADC